MADRRGFSQYEEDIGDDVNDAPIGAEASEPIGNHMGEVNISGSTTQKLILKGFVSLRELTADKFVPLRISEAQAQSFLRHTRTEAGDEEMSGDYTHAQLTRVKIHGFYNALPIDVAPVLAVSSTGAKLRAPARPGSSVRPSNGRGYALVMDASSEISALTRGLKAPIQLYENSKLLPAELVKRWQNVSLSELDKGVTDLPGTGDKLLDLDVNEFYPDSLHVHQHLLEEDIEGFNYADLYAESIRPSKGHRKVRVPAAALAHLRTVMQKKGISVVKENTLDLTTVGIALENPDGKDGSFGTVHAQLEAMGMSHSDVSDAMNQKHKVCVVASVSAVVH